MDAGGGFRRSRPPLEFSVIPESNALDVRSSLLIEPSGELATILAMGCVAFCTEVGGRDWVDWAVAVTGIAAALFTGVTVYLAWMTVRQARDAAVQATAAAEASRAIASSTKSAADLAEMATFVQFMAHYEAPLMEVRAALLGWAASVMKGKDEGDAARDRFREAVFRTRPLLPISLEVIVAVGFTETWPKREDFPRMTEEINAALKRVTDFASGYTDLLAAKHPPQPTQAT